MFDSEMGEVRILNTLSFFLNIMRRIGLILDPPKVIFGGPETNKHGN